LRRDRLISVGGVEIRHGKLALGRGFHGILRQDRGSSRENILVHGIGYTRQTTGDPPADLLMDFLDYAEKLPLIAFHAAFDQGFLQRAIRRHLGARFSNPFLDLAWLLPGLFGATQGKPRGLDDWMQRFGLSTPNRHAADADALAAAELFLIAVPEARRRGLQSFQQLSAFARREEQAAHWGRRG
jgi:DNA polymerase-3 subunit epsilon